MNGLRGGLAASALLVALGLGTAPAMADALVLNGGWDVFEFGGADTLVFDSSGSNDFTFSLSAPSQLRITDGYFDGDQFDVFINGVDFGSTSTPTIATTYIGDDWTAAYYSANFSHGTYNLGPGDYDVEALVVAAPYGVGAGAFALGAVPEPAAWAMMLVGFAGAGAVLRRRRSGPAV